MLLSAVIFGVGFGSAYPSYIGYVMRGVTADRRGAAFGAILAAFDSGIGTGSTTMGWVIQHYGFRAGFGVAAVLSAFALPSSAGRQIRRQSNAASCSTRDNRAQLNAPTVNVETEQLNAPTAYVEETKKRRNEEDSVARISAAASQAGS